MTVDALLQGSEWGLEDVGFHVRWRDEEVKLLTETSMKVRQRA